jgi:DNA-binding transcriptional MerR regulator
MKESYTLAELAQTSGTAPRTIRFYIARGILAGPTEAGRNAAYGRGHLERLEAIRKLKGQGLTLSEIAHRLCPDTARGELPLPAACHSYALSDDVTVLVRADVPPWRMNRIRRRLAELSALLRKESDDASDES